VGSITFLALFLPQYPDPFLFSFFFSGLQLMATGLELTPSYLIGSMSSLLILLFPVLILSWLVSALFLFAVFFDILDFWECLLVAACITPTDPVIASAIVKGNFN
jgi:NhaP-type Na+/H+ or K+/H+ antiporter